MSVPSERVLRWSGGLAVLGLVAVIGGSWWSVRDPQRPWSLPVDLGGTIDQYGDDTLVVSTTTRGLSPAVVTRETVVTELDAPAEPSALKPGRFVVVRGDLPASGRPLVARTIMVWGTDPSLPRHVR